MLLPQGKVEEAYQLVERTECLRPETKLGFLKHLKEVKERLDAQTKEQDAGKDLFVAKVLLPCIGN